MYTYIYVWWSPCPNGPRSPCSRAHGHRHSDQVGSYMNEHMHLFSSGPQAQCRQLGPGLSNVNHLSTGCSAPS